MADNSKRKKKIPGRKPYVGRNEKGQFTGGPSVLLRDAKGHFVSPAKRYDKGEVESVSIKRRGKYVTVISDGKVTPKKLAELIGRDDYESLPAASKFVKTVTSKKRKYKAFDIAEQIFNTRGIKDKLVKVTMHIMDGDRLRTVSFIHMMNRKGNITSFALYKHMMEAMGVSVNFSYNTLTNKLEIDRKGDEFKIVDTDVDVIQ